MCVVQPDACCTIRLGEYPTVCIIANTNLEISFTLIYDRIYIQMKSSRLNRYVVLISAYAPTPPSSEKDPEVRDVLYTQLTISREDPEVKDLLCTELTSLRKGPKGEICALHPAH